MAISDRHPEPEYQGSHRDHNEITETPHLLLQFSLRRIAEARPVFARQSQKVRTNLPRPQRLSIYSNGTSFSPAGGQTAAGARHAPASLSVLGGQIRSSGIPVGKLHIGSVARWVTKRIFGTGDIRDEAKTSLCNTRTIHLHISLSPVSIGSDCQTASHGRGSVSLVPERLRLHFCKLRLWVSDEYDQPQYGRMDIDNSNDTSYSVPCVKILPSTDVVTCLLSPSKLVNH